MTDEGRPTICFLTPNGYPLLADDTSIEFAGGAELQQVIIAKGLVKRGYSVSMICMDFGQDDEVEIDGVTVYRAWRPKSGLPVIRFFWPRLTSYWKCMKRANADIYCHRAASMLTGIMAFFCRRFGKKSVFSVAGKNKIRIRRDRWLFEFGLRRVDRVVVQNLKQQREVMDTVGRDSVLIPNCYRADAGPDDTNERSVLWVGAIRQVKRPDLYLELAESLPDFQFTMIGGPIDQEHALFANIMSRAKSIPNLSFLGFVPYSHIDQYFDEATLFVNTSDSEGFPNTFLQSWARGVPTVSFVDSGARMDGRRVGRMVSSLSEMAKATAELMKNDTERLDLGGLAKRYVDKHHAPDVVLDLYQNLFEEMR